MTDSIKPDELRECVPEEKLSYGARVLRGLIPEIRIMTPEEYDKLYGECEGMEEVHIVLDTDRLIREGDDGGGENGD